MHKCPYCNKQNFKNHQSFGAHLTNCKLNPNYNKIKTKIKKSKLKKWKTFKVKCYICENEIEIKEYNVNKPKKDKYFCNQKCANKYVSNLNKTKRLKKISNTLNKNYKNKNYRKCKTCGKKIHNNNKSGYCKKCIYTSIEYKNKMSNALKGKCGGYRVKGGRGKQGWFNGIFCNSSWELAYIIYCNDHNISIKRNNEGFEYIYKNKTHKYYPDFIVNEQYVEIQGYITDKDLAKFKYFKYNLKIVDKHKIKNILNYVETKYGKYFIKMYK